MKSTVEKFENGEIDVCLEQPTVRHLCVVTEGPISTSCEWFDDTGDEWEVAVLDDGTAITWCLDY